jgi:hypothetical protein
MLGAYIGWIDFSYPEVGEIELLVYLAFESSNERSA